MRRLAAFLFEWPYFVSKIGSLGGPGGGWLRSGEGQDGGREGQGLADQELEGSSAWPVKPPRTGQVCAGEGDSESGAEIFRE